MRRLIFFTGIFLLLNFLSCDKKDTITGPDELPVWLQLKITELVTPNGICNITDVTIIEYNGKKYYHIYAGLWSCVYCQLFDEQGNRPDWDSKGWEDFFAKEKDIQTVPACK
ncbi:MAG TPA: hypothetical protein VFC67_08695 [Prolixibacteraceae bacterium]|nr:hypothetical protein [Prolixibacteraceae bacterium]